jgi:uroporphyrinogen decarboxylase
MPTEKLSPRERWQAVLARRLPDRVPLDYWATPEATARLLAHLRCDDVWALYRRLHIDRPVAIDPPYCGPRRTPDTDEFGCRYARVAHAGGEYAECVSHPLAHIASRAQLEAEYVWPTADDYDYAAGAARRRGHEEYPVAGGGSEPFLTYCALRGMERALRDLLVNREFAEYCLDRLFDLAYEKTRRIYEHAPFGVDYSYVAEDFGTQEGLLIAPRLIREVFVPRMKRMADLAHQAGVHVFTHSDGAVAAVIPDFVRLGADVLNPIQWRCAGLDRAWLKREFGERLVFHGAMDNQHTLAFGSAAAVAQEVRDNIAVLGAGGGYILGPCHNIQVVTSPEVIETLYRTAWEAGWY